MVAHNQQLILVHLIKVLQVLKKIKQLLIGYSIFIYSPANTNDTLTKADLREAMTGWMENFEVFTFDQRQYYPGVDENFIPDGSVRSYGVWNGTHISGAKTKSKYYSVTRFNDEGKVTTALEWFDVGGVFDQLEAQN